MKTIDTMLTVALIIVIAVGAIHVGAAVYRAWSMFDTRISETFNLGGSR